MKQNALYYPASLGPRQQTVGASCGPYTADEILEFQKTVKAIFVGEEANYKDIFGDPHFTRVCQAISILGDPKTILPQQFEGGFKIEHFVSNCRRGNCDDDECRLQEREQSLSDRQKSR